MRQTAFWVRGVYKDSPPRAVFTSRALRAAPPAAHHHLATTTMMFAEYEAEFLSTTRTIADNIDQLSGLSGPEREPVAKASAGLVDSAADLVKQMEMEARSQPPSEARVSKAAAKVHQTSLAGLRKALKTAGSRGDRSELLGSSSSEKVPRTSPDPTDRSPRAAASQPTLHGRTSSLLRSETTSETGSS